MPIPSVVAYSQFRSNLMNIPLAVSPSILTAGVPPPARARFRPGDLVVLRGDQPLVCVVLAEPGAGLVRLSQAACPEIRLVAPVADVQPLAGWLLAEC
jgi:hypothetical protein